ncbi:MAG: YceI family protein [Hyphomicrobiaceae bacterium]
MALVRTALLILLFGTGFARAEPGDWTLLPKESRLGFQATEEGQLAEGGFGRFGGVIHFDKDHLEQARLDIEIDMQSVMSSYEEMPATLKTETWFDVARFPKARYVSTKISPDGKGGYRADGSLTLRGVSVPVTVAFRFESYGPKASDPKILRAAAKGEALLKRTAFGVGQGDWKSTDVVADPVKVIFTLAAEKPANG